MTAGETMIWRIDSGNGMVTLLQRIYNQFVVTFYKLIDCGLIIFMKNTNLVDLCKRRLKGELNWCKLIIYKSDRWYKQAVSSSESKSQSFQHNMTMQDLTYYFKPAQPGLRSVLQSTIDSVYRELKSIPSETHSQAGKKSGEYVKLEDDEKAIIPVLLVNTLQNMALQLQCDISKQKNCFPNLKEGTLYGWKYAYLQAVKHQKTDRKWECKPIEVKELPQKKHSRPLLLREELEEEVKLFITASRADGTVVNTETVVGTAKSVVISHDANLLSENVV